MSSLIENQIKWKPQEWCKSEPFVDSVDAFCRKSLEKLDQGFELLGLRARKVREDDYHHLMTFIRRYFYGHKYLNGPRLYQIISFGNSTLLENDDGIQGYILEVTYVNGVSHGASMAIHPDLKGLSVGSSLFKYSALTAMKHGAKMKKGIISPDNYASIRSIINGNGAIVTRFHQNLYGMGPKLMFNIPMDPTILGCEGLDLEKIRSFVDDGQIFTIDVYDQQSIEQNISDGNLIAGILGDQFITIDANQLDQNYLS